MIATAPIGEGVDANAYDAGTGLIFSSNGEGTLTIIHEISPGRFEAETIHTKRGARTMGLDPKTHKIYLPTADFETVPASKPGEPRKRPGLVKDSFSVLVVGK